MHNPVAIKINRPQAILIDLDGTLVDSVPDLAYCIDAMMQQMRKQTPGVERVRTWVGNGVETLVKRALTDQMDAEPDPVEFKQALDIFLQLYEKNASTRSVLYPGVVEGLDYFKQKLIPLACITNKAERFTIPILKDLGIFTRFKLVISGDTLAKKKPDPLPLLHAAQHFKIEPKSMLMIGDSVSDVKAARAAGLPIVCMSYGYNHGQDIGLAHPDAVLNTFLDLTELMT